MFNNPVVDYDDEVTRIIIDQVNMRIFESIKHWTVAELREFIFFETTDFDIKRISRGLTSEMMLLSEINVNMDLIVGAKINIENRQHNNWPSRNFFKSFAAKPSNR